MSQFSVELLAQAIHERWRQEAIANDETAPTWQDLDESRKNSSRDQARHVPVHLRKVGWAIAPLRDCEAKDFTFTDREIEPEKKNVGRKETPYLLPWKQLKKLYPDIAELDAVFIRAMPAILASAGLQIIRKASDGVVIDAE